jgi:hypothetical protein
MSSSIPTTTTQYRFAQSKPKQTYKSTPVPALPLHVISELWSLWNADPRVPTASSRRKWSALRQVDSSKVSTWFWRRKALAKKAGNPISQDTYELSLDRPAPSPPPVTMPVPNHIKLAGKKELFAGSPSARRHRSLPKKIKVEQLEPSLDDTAYNSDSAFTPFSDDTVIASSSPKFMLSSMSSCPSGYQKGPRKRAYSHSSDANDELQSKDKLLLPTFSTADTDTDTHTQSPSKIHQVTLSPTAPAYAESRSDPSPRTDFSPTNDPNPNELNHDTEDPTKKFCTQGRRPPKPDSSSNSEYQHNDSGFTCALCVPCEEGISTSAAAFDAFGLSGLSSHAILWSRRLLSC